MKIKILAGLLAACFFTLPVLAQPPALQQKAIVVKSTIQRHHFSPRAIDDSFSAIVFHTIIDAADEEGLLLTKNEYTKLATFKYSIDNELQGSAWGFVDLFTDLYKTALHRADSIIRQLAKKPFDFNAAEVYNEVSSKTDARFPTDVIQLSDKWRKFLKYQVLNRVHEVMAADTSGKTIFKSLLKNLEPEMRKNICDDEQKQFRKLENSTAGLRSFISEKYLDAIATAFDPHTNYLSPKGNEELQDELSSEGYYFGIVLNVNDKGNVIIEKLSPGGAAWKSGQVNKGDEILSLQWSGEKVINAEGLSREEVSSILDQSREKELIFRLKKIDGTINNVPLRKAKEDNESNIVRSFILKGDKKIGYIVLPGFYTEWENETGSSCANDVAKEIVLLKKENIDGLILDVRYNGGGSLGEAMEMAGIFINEGPLLAEKERDQKVVTLKDPNRGTIYDGPLTLMVNGQSASASEILAACLQDYNRAIIVGSNTYGKATMQTMFAVDSTKAKPLEQSGKNDVVKITIGKLYRMNGQTAQLYGVTPDVKLPDAFEGLEMGERFYISALPADSIKRNNYYKPLPYLPTSDLAATSAIRMEGSPEFKSIKKIIAASKAALVQKTIPLQVDAFEKWTAVNVLDMNTIKVSTSSASVYQAENHRSDKELIANNSFAKERNESWLKHLTDDVYIREAFLITRDFIILRAPPQKN